MLKRSALGPHLAAPAGCATSIVYSVSKGIRRARESLVMHSILLPRLLLLGPVAMTLCGCSLAGKARPVITYDDTSVPLGETAVFSPAAQHPGVPISADGRGGGAFVTMVDGKEFLANAVRVRPGTHIFSVGYIVFRAHGGAQVEIRDMKAGHVYGAHINRLGDYFTARPMDLGSSPDLGIYLGLKGVNMEFFPFDFGGGNKGDGGN